MSDRWQELAVFVRAAESGSFSRAGRELGLSQPSVSRIIGELEARLGELGDSAFGARRLETLERMIVASPAYLKARGTPKIPADLATHDCIFGPGNYGRDSWSFSRNGTEISVDVRGRISTDSGSGLLASVVTGLGITRASTVMAGDELKAGLLVSLLRGYKLAPVHVHAVFPGGPHPSVKVRALVDYLANELR